MIVTMHQPEHLPWLGFFDKMAQADLYIYLDTVQYRHQYFQNRNRIIGTQAPIWVTVPVHKREHRYGLIQNVRIDNSHNWRKTYWGSIDYHYHNHPYFRNYAAQLQAIVMSPVSGLAELNYRLIDFFREALAIHTPLVRCSELNVRGAKSDLILAACRAVGATTYISGPFGRDYLDEAAFRDAGIQVRYHDFQHPRYSQRGRGGFFPQLSVLDLLMNCGPESTRLLGATATVPAPRLVVA